MGAPGKARTVIEAEGLGKAYRKWHGAGARVLEGLTLGRRKGHELAWALRGVDFQLARGAALGLCGANGAGKSTLLKVLAGTTAPTEGRFRVRGPVASLLELGTGFHPDFTGRENVALFGVLAGHPRREVRRRMEAILEFSELGAAVDDPVRTYSTGMGMRLGFAAALGFEPEVLILDEVFAVGDLAFQEKCVQRLFDFKAAGHTILLCSHSLYDLRQLCDEALWLDGGSVRARGDATTVTNRYATWHGGRERELVPSTSGPDAPHLGQLELLCEGRPPTGALPSGADLELDLHWRDPRTERRPLQLGVAFYRQDRTLVAAATTQESGLHLEGPEGRARLVLPRLALLSGSYAVVVYLLDEAGVVRFEERALDQELVVEAGTRELGLVRLEHRWVLDAGTSVPGPGALRRSA